jgi:hypothetical protein
MPLGGFSHRHLLLMQRLRLPPQLPQEGLEVADRFPAGEGIAVSGDQT